MLLIELLASSSSRLAHAAIRTACSRVTHCSELILRAHWHEYVVLLRLLPLALDEANFILRD